MEGGVLIRRRRDAHDASRWMLESISFERGTSKLRFAVLSIFKAGEFYGKLLSPSTSLVHLFNVESYLRAVSIVQRVT